MDRRDGTTNPDEYYESGRAASDYRIKQLEEARMLINDQKRTINGLRDDVKILRGHLAVVQKYIQECW